MAGRIDCFVYGDTHKAGMCRKGDGPLAVNAGSLTHERKNGNFEEVPNTYMIVDDAGLTIRQLGRQEPLFMRDYN